MGESSGDSKSIDSLIFHVIDHSNRSNGTLALGWLLENAGEQSTQQVVDQQSETADDKLNAMSTKCRHIRALLEIVRIHKDTTDQPPISANDLLTLLEMGFEAAEIAEALDATNNNVMLSIAWLCGERQEAVDEAINGFADDSPILRTIGEDADFQMELNDPYLFRSEWMTLRSMIGV